MSGREGPQVVELEEALSRLPIFPLPGTVFFPGTLLPLHVFEPRYRRMTEAVLADHGLLAVVLMRGTDDGEAGSEEDLHAVAGLGRIVHHERMEDGRFHILLQGMGRVELLDELPDEGLPYRRARARMLADLAQENPGHVAEECKTLRACYAQLLAVCPEAREALGDLPTRISEPGALADIICATALEHPSTRQAALEDLSVVSRLRRACDALATVLLSNLGPDTPSIH